jgi:release factor glutamine methyltransferase
MNDSLTFLALIDKLQKQFSSIPKTVIYNIIYSLSHSVKSLNDLTININNNIDFNYQSAINSLNDYDSGKPLGKINNKLELFNIKIQVNDNTFFPRNETELLIEEAIKNINKYKCNSVVDLCSGSGIIAIAIAKNTNAKVSAVEINNIAIQNTIIPNIKLNNVNINVYQGDFFKTLISNNLKFDCIVMNPPYVDINVLEKNMTQYESSIAFNNSADPLFFYKQIINNIKQLVNDYNNFLLLFEIGYDQKNELIKVLTTAGLYQYASFIKDYSNNDRILIVKK